MYFRDDASKTFVVDTGSNVAYSIVVGASIDYCMGGLSGWGIFWARTTATGANSLTSGYYGRWQDTLYKVLKIVPEQRTFRQLFSEKNLSTYFEKEKRTEIVQYSGRRGKQFLTDMLAFNTFQPLVYGFANCIGQLINAGEIDFQKVAEGMKGVVFISPFIAPTTRWAMQGTRKLFGVKTSTELAQENLETIVSKNAIGS